MVSIGAFEAHVGVLRLCLLVAACQPAVMQMQKVFEIKQFYVYIGILAYDIMPSTSVKTYCTIACRSFICAYSMKPMC